MAANIEKRHLPIAISASKNANLIFLEDARTVSYLPDCYGYEVEDVFCGDKLEIK